MTTLEQLFYSSPIFSLLQPWASKVWERAKENNSTIGNSISLQTFINNVTDNGKYSLDDIYNIISAHKLVKNQYPTIPIRTADFTTKMLELSPKIKNIPRLKIAGIRLLISEFIYPADGSLYEWLNGKDNDGVISKTKAVFQQYEYKISKIPEINDHIVDKMETVAKGTTEDLQVYLKYGAIILVAYTILKGTSLLKELIPKS